MRVIPALFAAAMLSGCVAGYTLVPSGQNAVAKNAMSVSVPKAWNKAPGSSFEPVTERWTQNGMGLDRITFVGGLNPGQTLAKQAAKEGKRLPAFTPEMSPQDLTSMVETYYRVRAGAKSFNTAAVAPTTFLGHPGIQYDFAFTAGDDVKRRGRTVLAVVNSRLFMMTLDGTDLHYFDAARPEFDAMTSSAKLP
jgi:hypothetical protein